MGPLFLYFGDWDWPTRNFEFLTGSLSHLFDFFFQIAGRPPVGELKKVGKSRIFWQKVGKSRRIFHKSRKR